MLDKRLLEILVCPQCKGELEHEMEPEALVCHACALRYEVRDGIPVLLIDEAESLGSGAGADDR